MKIRDIFLTKKHIDFKHSYGISSANFTGESFLILKLVAEDGTIGLADSVTAIPFGYEDVDTMIHIIRKYLFPTIRGMDSLDMEAIETSMKKATPGHPMAKAAIACGADGLLVEVHINPKVALSDGQQSLDSEQFNQFMKDIRPFVEAAGREL